MVKTRSQVRRDQEIQERPPPASPEPPRVDTTTAPASITSSRRSSVASNVLSRERELRVAAAKEKAKVQIEYIERQLEADLADLRRHRRNRGSRGSSAKSDVEQWVRSGAEQAHPVHDCGMLPDRPSPPADMAQRDAESPAIRDLATAIRDLAVSSSVEKTTVKKMWNRLCASKELPAFSGDPIDWLQFKQAYNESTNICHFSEQENLWRLRKCLTGAAKDAVAALLMSATTPELVMSSLELLYGNPDTIISRVIADVNKLEQLPLEYHRQIIPFSVRVRNFVAAVKAIGRDEYLQHMGVATAIISKFPTGLITRWADFHFERKKGCSSKLEMISDFLNKEALKIATSNVNLSGIQSDVHNHRQYNHGRKQTILVNQTRTEFDITKPKCKFCRGTYHKLLDCKRFKRALRKERWLYVKRYRICFKCLSSRHDRETCPAAACDVDGCGAAHHRLLHYVPSRTTSSDTGVRDTTHEQAGLLPVGASEMENQQATINYATVSNFQVLLKVVPIYVHGPNGIIKTSALLDDGATVSMIKASLASRAGLCGRRETIIVRAWNNVQSSCDVDVLDIKISNVKGERLDLFAHSVKELRLSEQDYSNVNVSRYAHLFSIKNDLYNDCVEPEILIGQDNYHLLTPLRVLNGERNEPCATLTPLGWCVHGRVPVKSQLRNQHYLAANNATVSAYFVDCELQELHEEVRRSFAIDAMGVMGKPRENAEEVRAVFHLEKTSKFVDGSWQVGLPWKDINCKMPDSYPTALSRLKGVEKKMSASEGYAQRYTDRVNHLFDNNFAEEMLESNSNDSPRTWYLPHFGVDNPNKKKLRLVFDAASKSNGLSLNDYLLKGPDLLLSLSGIMLRFREFKVAVTADIKDMFLKVKIQPEDRDSLRFLWRKGPKEPVKIYNMTSLIFGANCSPFVAQFVKNKNAKRFVNTMPLAVNAICNQHYMDDYIHSLPEVYIATELVRDVTYIHKQGGFEIRNWTSNHVEVLNDLPRKLVNEGVTTFKVGPQEGERTLGMIWYPHEDMLGFDLSFKKIPESLMSGKQIPTKRQVLRIVMTIFDVYGILSPFTINGKIILQDTWRLNIDWDDVVSEPVYKKWCDWLKLLKHISDIRVPRHYQAAARASEMENENHIAMNISTRILRPISEMYKHFNDSYNNLQLHVFCDASSKAMCSVAYWRWKDNNRVNLAFIASKCRIAPVKSVTIPRLELQAAVLAARLASTIKSEHRLSAEQRYFWCDSTTVLHWIKNDARNYKTFVAHRLGEIDELTEVNEWRYLSTKMNVADIATREISCNQINLCKEWLNGPDFLREDERNWPVNLLESKINPSKLEMVYKIETVRKSLSVPTPERFSSWIRLLRTTTTVLKFTEKCRRRNHDEHSLMKRAERLLFMHAQSESFALEINALRAGSYVENTSRILTLSPFIDNDGLLRAEGRIKAAAGISFNLNHPVILDGRHYITRLIVKRYHEKAAHGYQELVVNNLREKFWIIRVRPTVKFVASRCMLCRIRKAKPIMPRMGDLPEARLAHHQRPFTHCGVDLFGPIEVTVNRHKEKRYGVLFTCLTVRAIHIEIVHSLTTDAMIMALRRMASRRGWPRNLNSDNGTNLKGADTELKRAIMDIDEGALKDEALNNAANWTFIPPVSPHWGGAWERLIRTVKNSLKVTLRERAPRDEVLSTLLIEVENIVNSRPLTHVSVEPGSSEALTPNHFILGSSSGLPCPGTFDESDLFLRKQWRISQMLINMFWRRWMKEVLPIMVPRAKWNREVQNLKVGDLVFVVDPDAPRGVWPRGVITKICPSHDGRVRVVEVRTKTGVLRRSASRVANIPIEI